MDQDGDRTIRNVINQFHLCAVQSTERLLFANCHLSNSPIEFEMKWANFKCLHTEQVFNAAAVNIVTIWLLLSMLARVQTLLTFISCTILPVLRVCVRVGSFFLSLLVISCSLFLFLNRSFTISCLSNEFYHVISLVLFTFTCIQYSRRRTVVAFNSISSHFSSIFNWIWLDSNDWTQFKWNRLHKHTYSIWIRNGRLEQRTTDRIKHKKIQSQQPSI